MKTWVHPPSIFNYKKQGRKRVLLEQEKILQSPFSSPLSSVFKEPPHPRYMFDSHLKCFRRVIYVQKKALHLFWKTLASKVGPPPLLILAPWKWLQGSIWHSSSAYQVRVTLLLQHRHTHVSQQTLGRVTWELAFPCSSILRGLEPGSRSCWLPGSKMTQPVTQSVSRYCFLCSWF
jgi:hypothetical protein